MNQKSLYFIAIIPPKEIALEVTQFKEEAKRLFKSAHALKSPPHITLIPPFCLDGRNYKQTRDFLRNWVIDKTSFYLTMDGFDCFSPRVIYIKNESSRELDNIQKNLLINTYEYHQIKSNPNKPYHPHMTIVFKDLNKAKFDSAWLHFSQKKYKRIFLVDRIFLLNHDKKQWQISDEFLFS